ncbi:MAG: ABC transporter substrate binding protein [Elusimicrobiota bacterium]
MAIAVALILVSSGWAKDEVVAVLGSDAMPYREALAGFEQEYGGPVPTVFLSQGEPHLPPEVRIVAAFGAKAVVHEYGRREWLVCSMSPGTVREGPRIVRVGLEPSPAELISRLIRMQPGLKRLGVVWTSDPYEGYLESLSEAAESLGVSIEGRRARSPSDIPLLLRDLHRKVDALWLPPDPLLLSQGSMVTFRDFSLSNQVPLYVPTEGLVKDGVFASAGVGFREVGRSTGRVVRDLLAGSPPKGDLYPKVVTVAVSKTAAESFKQRISGTALQQADKVLP